MAIDHHQEGAVVEQVRQSQDGESDRLWHRTPILLVVVRLGS